LVSGCLGNRRLCSAALFCLACALSYPVYGTCIIYVVRSTRHHCLQGLRYLRTFYAGLRLCPTWPEHNFSIGIRPRPIYAGLACHIFWLTSGPYTGQVISTWYPLSTCRYLPYARSTLPAHLPYGTSPAVPGTILRESMATSTTTDLWYPTVDPMLWYQSLHLCRIYHALWQVYGILQHF